MEVAQQGPAIQQQQTQLDGVVAAGGSIATNTSPMPGPAAAALAHDSANRPPPADTARFDVDNMKIACLQFAPELGQVERNKARAEALLESSDIPSDLDWLILPEMALSGYNFPSLEAITPFLEPTTAGTTTKWAQRIAVAYGCHVTVGYPEITTSREPKRYNSTVTVSPRGEVLANYRKHFLYYTDETWASEGDSRFFNGIMGSLGQVSHGICMDLNPYKFVADWSEYEFASDALKAKSPLVVLSTAWITRMTPEELAEAPLEPDLETETYWLERMRPILLSKPTEPVVIVFANRCGQEGGVCYAGSSMVVRVGESEISIYNRLGRKEEKCLIVDTRERPRWTLLPFP